MHTIVTKLTLAKPFDAELMRRMETEFFVRAREVSSGFLGAQVVQMSDTETVLIAFFASREALDEISSKVAGPWFAANVRQYLAGPVHRSVGEVIAHLGA